MSSSDGASDTYGKLLLMERLGYPLWYPDPDENLPREYRDEGVRIGDVGTITGAGQFAFYFNVHEDSCAFNWLQPWPTQRSSRYSNARSRGNVIKRGSVTKRELTTDGTLP
jgi:hypothetical protein